MNQSGPVNRRIPNRDGCTEAEEWRFLQREIGHAFETDRLRLIGLTSERNLDFVTGLGCHGEVVSYDSVGIVAERASGRIDPRDRHIISL